MTRIHAYFAAPVLIACLGAAPGVGRADTLEQACLALDEGVGTSCLIERPDDHEWVLHTAYPIGTGRKSSVELVEARFCQAARSAGVAGRVQRAGELPGAFGKGALMEWDCGPPAVSAAPRRR